MKRRIISALVCVNIMILTFCRISFAEGFWDVYRDYQQAIEKNNSAEIIACVKRIENVYKNPVDEIEYKRLTFAQERAGLEYEKLYDYASAADYYNRSLNGYKWLNGNGSGYGDKLKTIPAIIQQLNGMFEVYTLSDNAYDTPFHGEINEPDSNAGTLFGMCSAYGEVQQSADLIYVQFFTEDISKFAWKLPEDKNTLVEIGWNVPNENYGDLIGVLECYDYIKRNVDWLSAQDYKFLIRFGAEVNCWEDLSNHVTPQEKQLFIEKYKNAFSAVADCVHKYAPNCAMVYSPNDISNLNYDIDEFYPGDEYVDWVGMSTYNNISAASGNVGNQYDALYGRGVYENQMIRIKKIVDLYADRKPILISECGFAYRDDSGIQTYAHASQSLKYFYTYVNMLFPQIRAVLYFNVDINGKSYSVLNNSNFKNLYLDIIGANLPMQKTLTGNGKSYIRLSNFNENTDELTFYSYSYHPRVIPTVTYELDGNVLQSAQTYPYKCTLERPNPGFHTFKVTSHAGSNTKSKSYGIFVSDNGNIEFCEATIDDVSPASWAYESAVYVTDRQIFNGTAPGKFEPNSKLTRAMLVTVLGRLDGIENDVYAVSPFSDVIAGKYYSGYVKWAYDNSIVNGKTPQLFAPSDYITREQTAAVFYRYVKYKNFRLTQPADISGYHDAASVSDYAKEAMCWANAEGIISGDTPTTLSPKGNATRAQIAKMIMILNIKFKIKQ